MGSAMATNSIYSNTDASVFFYIVTLRDAIKLTRCFTLIPPPSIVTAWCVAISVPSTNPGCFNELIIWIVSIKASKDNWEITLKWSELNCHYVHVCFHRQYIEKTELKGIKYKILEFNPMVLKGKVKPDSSRPDLLHPVSTHTHTHTGSNYNLTTVTVPKVPALIVLQLNFVRFYLPLLDISHKRVIYLDDDVIVQGTEMCPLPFSPVLSCSWDKRGACIFSIYIH